MFLRSTNNLSPFRERKFILNISNAVTNLYISIAGQKIYWFSESSRKAQWSGFRPVFKINSFANAILKFKSTLALNQAYKIEEKNQ